MYFFNNHNHNINMAYHSRYNKLKERKKIYKFNGRKGDEK